MPRVPTYERRVEPRPLPTPQRGPVPGPEVFGSQQAEALAGVGSTITRAGAGGLQVVLQQHELARRRAEEAQFVEADNKYSTWRQSYLYDPQHGILSPSNPASQGKQSLGLPDTVRADHDKVTEEIGAELHGARLQAAWRRRTIDQWHRIDADVQQHVSVENLKYENNESLKGVALATSSALAHAASAKNAPPDSTIWIDQVNADLQDGIAKVHSFAGRNGLGDNATKELELQFTTGVHKGIIEGLLTDGKDKAAQAYYTATTEQISGDARIEIRKALESGSVTGDAMRTSAEIWQAMGPSATDDVTPIEYDKMQERAQALFPDDAKRYESTLHFLQQKAASVEAGRKARANATESTVWKAIGSGAALGQVMTMPEFRRLDGQTQAQIQNFITNRAATIASRQAAQANLAYTQASHAWTLEQHAEARKVNAGKYEAYRLMRPEVAAGMTDDEVWKKTPEIGLENVEQVIQQRHKYATNPLGRDDFRSDMQVIDSVLRPYGIDITPKEGDTAGKARAGWLLDQIAAAQRRAEGPTQKKLTNEQLAGITKEIVGRTLVSTPPSWFGLVGGTSKGPMQIKFTDIPTKERLEIRNRLINEYRVPNPTNDQIITAWLNTKMAQPPPR